jgi:hypothetical protein
MWERREGEEETGVGLVGRGRKEWEGEKEERGKDESREGKNVGKKRGWRDGRNGEGRKRRRNRAKREEEERG